MRCVSTARQRAGPHDEAGAKKRADARGELEPTGAIGRAETGRAVPSRSGVAQIRAARTIAAAGHVVQVAGVTIGIRAIGDAARVAGQGIDAGDDRRGHAGAAENEPPAQPLIAVAIIDGNAGVGVGYRRDISDGTLAANGSDVADQALPRRLRIIFAASAAGTTPRRLAPAACVVGAGQRGAADSGDILAGGGILCPIATVAGTGGDG